MSEEIEMTYEYRTTGTLSDQPGPEWRLVTIRTIRYQPNRDSYDFIWERAIPDQTKQGESNGSPN